MIFTMTACGGTAQNKNAADDGKLSVVTTIFPEYDWVREVLGDKAKDADLTLLLDNGADLHSYQLSAEDIMKIAESDVFIYVGGESDDWVDDVVEKSVTDKTKVINLMDVIGDKAKEEEIVEGMQEDDHDHDHEDEGEEDHDEDHDADHDEDHEDEDHDDEDHEDEDHEHEEGPVYDEHVWLSLRNAEVIVNEIEDALSDADPENADTYEANAEAYVSELKALDGQYEEAVAKAKTKTVLFGDRFPFRYMTDDYGIKYYAAFVGCSAETEASFETITFLADKVDELGLTSVLTIDGSDGKIAETIVENTKKKNQKVLTLDSMQSKASKEIERGKTYISAMENNLKVLEEALN